MSENKTTRDPSRRVFIKAGLASFGVSMLASSAVALDFLFPKVLYEPSKVLRLLRLDELPDQKVIFDEEHRLFIFKRPEGVAVLTAVCTHLGCTVSHRQAAGGFRCPCHGSVFNDQGDVLSGPAPKSLTWFFADLTPDGRLQVHTDRPVAPEFLLRTEGAG